MKIIYTTLLIMLSSSLVLAQKSIKEKDITVADNIIYYYKDKPLNSTFKIKYNKPNDHFSEVATFIDGVKEGKAKILRFNKLEAEGNYKNGKREGIWNGYLYSTGKLLEITNYKNGEKHGLELDYLFGADTLFYVNGKLDGLQIKTSTFSRTETLYKQGIPISSVEYDDLRKEKVVCNYSGVEGENKECARTRIPDSGQQVDSIFSTKLTHTHKSYLNNELQYQVKVQTAKDGYKCKDIIAYYEKDKLVMIDEIYSDKPIDINDRLLMNIYGNIKRYEFNESFRWGIQCDLYTSVYYKKCEYFIYRLNSNGTTFNKSKLDWDDGGDDYFPGCRENEIEYKAQIPPVN